MNIFNQLYGFIWLGCWRNSRNAIRHPGIAVKIYTGSFTRGGLIQKPVHMENENQ
jgi:hypothetical protein